MSNRSTLARRSSKGETHAQQEIPVTAPELDRAAAAALPREDAGDVRGLTAWKEKFKDNILDMGGKLGPSGKVLTTSGVMDGPFVEAKEIVGGYMIVAADSYEQAMEVAKEGPGMVMPGTRIEIREITRS